ncbi:MAG: hypothetical protein QE278_05710 [Limnobacter sp.]|nr:hypothetical protein [Limnobacter sp.]
MGAAEHLAKFGVTVAQAKEFILANLNNPQEIFNVAKQFGVTNAFLAEIYGGVTTQEVISFFDSVRIDSRSLDPVSTGGSGNAPTNSAFPAELANSAFANLVKLNTETGVLSTANLKNGIVSKTGLAAYNSLFSSSGVDTNGDGQIGATDLGLINFTNLAATPDNIQSLYFDTLINTYKSIDFQEIQQIGDFVDKNAQALANEVSNGQGALFDQYIKLIISVFEDPATPPIFSDAQLADLLIASTASIVGVASGQADFSLFGSFVDGFAAG